MDDIDSEFSEKLCDVENKMKLLKNRVKQCNKQLESDQYKISKDEDWRTNTMVLTLIEILREHDSIHLDLIKLFKFL